MGVFHGFRQRHHRLMHGLLQQRRGGLGHGLQGGTGNPLRHDYAAGAVGNDVNDWGDCRQIQLRNLAGAVGNPSCIEGSLSRGDWRQRSSATRIHEGQGHHPPGTQLRCLPEAGIAGGAVIAQETETPIRYCRAGHEAWAADNTSGHGGWDGGGVEGVVDKKLDRNVLGRNCVCGRGANDLVQARDACERGAEAAHFREVGEGEHDAGDDDEDDAQHRDLHQQTHRTRNERRQDAQEVADDQCCGDTHQAGCCRPHGGVQDSARAEVTQLAVQQERTDDRAGDKTEAVGGTE